MRLWDRIRFRRIPQAPWSWRNFLVGHLADFWGTQPCHLYESWQQQLGGIYLIFLGKTPVVVLSGKAPLAVGLCGMPFQNADLFSYGSCTASARAQLGLQDTISTALAVQHT